MMRQCLFPIEFTVLIGGQISDNLSIIPDEKQKIP
jgi:hypothetical protein